MSGEGEEERKGGRKQGKREDGSERKCRNERRERGEERGGMGMKGKMNRGWVWGEGCLEGL